MPARYNGVIRVLLALIVFAFAATDARAATVTFEPGTPPVDEHDHTGGGPSVVTLRAASGEANDIDISGTNPTVFRDAGAPLIAGTGCQGRPDGSVSCPGEVVYVEVGDGDDRVVAHEPISIFGGPGDDVLIGGDDMQGGPGRDQLTGTDGDDRLDGGPGTDTIDGGAGSDMVQLGDRKTAVVVDLARSTAGGDTVTGIEGVEGTSGNDRLFGDDGNNRLLGGGGDDVILGRGGDDYLDGMNGDDRIVGGDGNDALIGERLDGGDGDDGFSPGRSVRCGAGHDDIYGGRRTMPIGTDCEKIVPVRGLGHTNVDVEDVRLGRSLSLTLHRDELAGDTRVRILVKLHGRIIGRHTSHIGWVRHRVMIPLSRRARDVQIVFRGHYVVTEFRFRAERPRAGTSARARPRPEGRRRSGP